MEEGREELEQGPELREPLHAAVAELHIQGEAQESAFPKECLIPGEQGKAEGGRVKPGCLCFA